MNGPDPELEARANREAFERRAEEYGLWQGLETMPQAGETVDVDLWDEEEQDEVLAGAMSNIAFEENNIGHSQLDGSETPQYFPYSDKIVFLLDVIDNLPRLWIPGSLMRVFLWLLRELGVPQVPSYDHLRKEQSKLHSDKGGVPTIHWRSPKGNAFSFNDPRVLVANDWANPLVCNYIHPYPVIPKGGVISEIYHALKWGHDCDRHILSPMWDDGRQRHYYIDEPARLKNGDLVLPIRWLEDEATGTIWADAWRIQVDAETRLATILDETTIAIATHDLAQNLLDLEDSLSIPTWCPRTVKAGHPSHMPNPDRKLAEGDPLYSSFIDVFGDDVSGNRRVVKYLWHCTHTSWSTQQKKLYTVRLQATNITGLSIHALRANYIMQYANSLIGRQFKSLVQVNAFLTHDLVDSSRFAFTKAVGELSALLWMVEIRNLEEYLSDIDVAVANVLDIAAVLDPSKIVAKIKYHLLSHLRQDITRFGPLVGVATEIFESFNTVFRSCSVLSNHLAPSRDIAHQLAAQETVKHYLCGGWWAESNGSWRQAGDEVRGFLTSNPVLQTLCGWTPDITLTTGSTKLSPQKTNGPTKQRLPRQLIPWAKTLAAHAINAKEDLRWEALSWHACCYVVAASQDKCKIGSWVFVKAPIHTSGACSPPITGRIIEIIQDNTSKWSLVSIDIYQISSERHFIYGMPSLAHRHDEALVRVVSSS
ncbi:hypothetical protein DXG01_004700, partial [Tephrocybe rancida]